jgi:ornithine cyclodeaminase
MLVLRFQDLYRRIGMRHSVEIVERFFRDFESWKYIWPPRMVLHIPEKDAVWLNMPSYSLVHGAFVVKVINEYRANPVRYGLEAANGLVFVFDVETGVLKALLDAVALTALRTGAIGGVAARYMSREDSTSVGVVGSGRTAWALLEALNVVRDLEGVRVFSPTKSNRERFAARVRDSLGLKCSAVDGPREAVTGVDVVLAATNSAEPVFNGGWLGGDVHVTSIGALPTRRELDLTTLRRASVIAADLKDAVLREAGDIIAAVNQGVIKPDDVRELHEIVKSGVNVRGGVKMITLLKSVGFAPLDLFFSVEVLRRAEAEGIGWVVNMSGEV